MMASVAGARGQLEEALATAQDACAKADASGSRHVFAQGLGVVGDLLLKLGRVDEALDQYTKQLALYDEVDNRAARVDAQYNIASALYQEKRPAEVLPIAQEALQTCKDLGDEVRQADILELLAAAYNRLNDPRRAIGHLREALTILPERGDRSTRAERLGNLGSLYIAINQRENALQAYRQADALFSSVDARDAVGPPIARMRNGTRDTSRFGARLNDRSPLVPPLLLGLGTMLTAWLDAVDVRRTFLDAMEARRGAIHASMGLRPPPVLLTENRGDLAEDAYQIAIEGVPLPNVRLNAAATIEDIAEPLHSVMRSHLYRFVGHQQTLDIVERIAPGRAATFGNHPEALSRFVLLLRNLLDEGVPLLAFDDILETFFDLHYTAAPRLAVLRALRLLPKVRAQLPGNVRDGCCLRLPEDVEREISCAVRDDDSGAFLSLPPERTRRVLAMVRRSLEARADCTAVVVTTPAIRRYVKKLIALEFPGLPVLSSEELLPEKTGSIRDVLPPDSA
jgi:tetratricopeptide (TPR) repeat protein